MSMCRNSRTLGRSLVVLLLAVGAGNVSRAVAQAWSHPAPDLPTLVGERLEFRLSWQGFTAANATLEVLDPGAGQIEFRATARTVGLADLLYPVRSQIRSTSELSGFRSVTYVKDGKEGRGPPGVEEIVFELDKGLAYFTEDGETREPVEVPADVRDPFSAFYAFRVSDPGADGMVELTISDGKRTKAGKVRFVGRERVTVPAGTFDTIKIAPDIEGLGGVFRKSPGATLFIWLTDDEWRRPVMLRSKVSVGSFTAKLTHWSHGDAEVDLASHSTGSK